MFKSPSHCWGIINFYISTKMNRVAIGGVSFILVVGVCIGLIASVTHKNGSNDTTEKDVLSTTSKSVAAICSPTQFKQACVDTLGSVANNESAVPKDFIQAAIHVTLQELQAALNKSGSIFGSAVSDKTVKMAKDDCDELLQYAVDELQASFSVVGDSDLHNMEQREAEIKNWLNAVISFQESCVDQIPQPQLQQQLSNGLLNASQLTSNALAIVNSISQIMSAFNLTSSLNLNLGGGNDRQLMDEPNPDHDTTYPSWVSSKDRKLLAGGNNAQLTPNAVVAKDGSGQYKTIGDALKAYPKNLQGRYVIYVKAGIYNEYITVDKDKVNVFMYGDGPRKTMVTGRKSNRDGYTTTDTASFSAIGDGFIAKAMGFQNTAGPEGHQAVALRVISDRAVFYNCRMDGYQDTLYVQAHRQFYRNCVISGTVDFIFGDSNTIIQNSLLIVRKPMDNQQNIVTAHGRKFKQETTGLVIQNCRIVPDQALFPVRFKIRSYLGRPWKEHSRTVIMESTIGDFIQPAGWLEWAGNFALNTLYYAEYANRGPGAATNGRVKWKGYKVITNRNEALQFTAGPFLQGQTWLAESGVPFFLGFRPPNVKS
ncbi:PREDICTED: pectinesterase [Theobroma cacao]|uniref:Pectinesterase n=1 Tax=Theobroma cacao TaxID=3641 RepID=A0AB32W4G8_THECC|nr:PREDICTED: pectinesterase [Theobroma cacao]